MEKLIKSMTIQKRLMEIRELVSVDLDSAREILQSIILDNQNDFYLMEINCVTNMIKEEERYQELTPSQKRHYDCLKVLGRNFYDIGDYERAYYHYELAKEEIDHPIFDYYLGKMLYKQKKYLDALPYFQEYYSHGGKKLPNCLLYIIKIYEMQKDYKKVNKLSLKLKKLEDTFGFNFQFRVYSRRNRNEFYDYVKNIAVENISMSLEDFLEEEALELESYEDYNFLQKLQVIKNLMMQHQLKRAECYLKNLVPETKEEKKELQQFQKSKKVYRNKR